VTRYPGSSQNTIKATKSRNLRWVRHVARMEEMKTANNIVVIKPEGKRPLGRPRCKLESSIRIDVREIWPKVMDWVQLVQNRDQ